MKEKQIQNKWDKEKAYSKHGKFKPEYIGDYI